jgi:hypothetical protein
MSAKITTRLETVKIACGVWSSDPITVSDLYDLNQNNLLDSSMAYQRPEQAHWKKPAVADSFIMSVFRGWYLQPIQVRIVDGIYQLADGKQRTALFMRVLGDIYSPVGLVDEWEVLNGKTFSFWPKTYQDTFKSALIDLKVLDLPDDSDLVSYFVCVNRGGVPLTVAGAKRGQFTDKLTALSSVIKSPIWAECGIKGLDVEKIIMQLCMSEKSESPDYSSKTLIDWFIAYDMKSAVVSRLESAVDKFASIVAVNDGLEDESPDKIAFKRILKTTHIESVLYGLLTGGFYAVDSADLHLNLVQFFGQDKRGGGAERVSYIESSSQATATTASILNRHDIIASVLGGVFERVEKTEKTEKPKKSDKKSDKTADTDESSDTVKHSAFMLECIETFGAKLNDHNLAEIEKWVKLSAVNDPKPAIQDGKMIVRFIGVNKSAQYEKVSKILDL